MTDPIANCPLCSSPLVTPAPPDRAEAYRCECPRCKCFQITEEALDELRDARNRRLLWAVSAEARQAAERGRPVLITTGNWRECAEAHLYTTVSSKKQRLLELVRNGSSFFGDWVKFDFAADYPLIDAVSQEEAWAIIRHLRDRHLLSISSLNSGEYRLTVEAWEMLEPTTGAGLPGLCFIAMAFHPDLNDAFRNGMVKAVEADCGFRAIRIDEVRHNEKICDRIVAEIRRAQFVVADFTFHRPNVYYEAGYAKALGREVIWSCRQDGFAAAQFDTRQYPHIIWSDPEDLRSQLRDRIRALIPGARKPSAPGSAT